MSEPTAQRTLVKSPPELWAEVSDVECLAKHLGEFGEIRITRVEPETTVAWEGERASGTVILEPSGWGTKVTLTATPSAVPEPPPAPPAPPVVHDDRLERGATDVREVSEPEPVAPAVPAPLSANELLQRSGFFTRMFRKRAEAPEPPAPPPPPVAVPDPEPDPEPPGPEPDPLPEPTPLPTREPEPEGPLPAAAIDVEKVLTGVLDTLGAAHHRPFSR